MPAPGTNHEETRSKMADAVPPNRELEFDPVRDGRFQALFDSSPN